MFAATIDTAARLEQLFDNAPTLVLVLRGPDHLIDYANPAYMRFVGPRTLRGRPYREALADIAAQGYLERLDEVLRSGEPFVGTAMPTRIERPAEPAEVRWFDFVYQPLLGAGGAVEGIVGQANDVTARVDADRAAQQNQARLELAARAAGLGIWEWRVDTGQMLYSARAKEICGFAPDQEISFADVVAVTHPDDYPFTSAQSRRALDPRVRDRNPYEYRVVRGDGVVRWVRAHGEAVFEPTADGERAVRYIGTLEDITERREIEERLRASEARLRLAIEAGRTTVWTWDVGRDAALLTDELRAVLGLPAGAEASVEERRAQVHPDDRAGLAQLRERVLTSHDRFLDFEFRYFWPDGRLRWLQARSEILRTAAGQPTAVTGVIMDVTERRESEERLTLLAREVDHRANNLLSVIQGTVALSTGATPDELRQVITGRLAALARAHQLLSDARWTGADLHRLLSEELRPFGLDERVTLAGPPCSLSPPQAQAMAMAIHELATNAVKYGALSVPSGVIELSWSRQQGKLRLGWLERGGPPVSTPTRVGLGASILERALAGALGGAVAREWRPEGLACRLTLPLGEAAALENAGAS